MKQKGLQETSAMIILLFFAAISITIIILSYAVTLKVEDLVDENQLLVNKKVIYARDISSSNLLDYEDDSGVHKGMFDIDKIKNLDKTLSFQTFSYQSDFISPNGYLHYVKVEVLGKDDKVEFSQSQSLPSDNVINFPVNVRYPNGDVKLGKLYVDIIKK